MGSHHHHHSSSLSWAIALNLAFSFIEIIGGLLTNSLTILSDALHDLGDSLVLIIAWIAEKKAQKKPDLKKTFGYRRLSLAAAVMTAVILMTGSLLILAQAIPRLFNPQAVYSEGMIGLALLGIIFNGLAFFKLRTGENLNQKTLTWHLIEDILGWVVVLIGSAIIYLTDLTWVDPLMTIGYTIFITWGVGKNLKESLNILMQGVPSHIDLEHIRQGLLAVPEVIGVHDLHVWSLDGATDVFTGHIVIKDQALAKAEKIRALLKRELSTHHIEHSTIELESESFCSGVDCLLDHQNHKQLH